MNYLPKFYFLLEAFPRDELVSFDLTQTFFTLLNTSFVIAVLGFLLYNPVRKFLHAREDRISAKIDSANAANQKAESLQLDLENQLKQIHKTRDEVINEARKNAGILETKILDEARKNAASLIARANSSIELEKLKARDELKTQVISLSIALAKRYIKTELNPTSQEKYLDDIINELGDVKWTS